MASQDVDDSNFALHGRGVPLLIGLLALVVAFVAVCLYLRWACTRRRRRAADLEASSSAAAASRAIPGLDADAINGLPVTLYSPTRSTGEKGGGGEEEQVVEAECSICISARYCGLYLVHEDWWQPTYGARTHETPVSSLKKTKKMRLQCQRGRRLSRHWLTDLQLVEDNWSSRGWLTDLQIPARTEQVDQLQP